MTAALDLDITTMTIHTAPTLDLTPDPPIRARTTTLGYESCDRRPLRSPVPDPDSCSPDDLLDYCANCRTHVDMRYDMTDELKLAIISLVERQAIKLDACEDEVRAATNQLAVQQGIGAALEERATLCGQSAIVAHNEFAQERVLRIAAQQDLEDMRQTAIRRGRELADMTRIANELRAALHGIEP